MTTGLNRCLNEKYYTKLDIVNLCYGYIQENLNIDIDDLIIEPSAGNGAFIECIKNLSNVNLFLDIEPENNNIIKYDYLNFDIDKFSNDFPQIKIDLKKSIHIIGNPPFGRQSSLANKFIKKSCDFCDSISFILPKSFKKDSMRKFFPLNFHLIFEIDLPEESFLVNENPHKVPCVFQIWVKKEYNREEVKKIEPLGYEFVKCDETPNISFRRVGVNAGMVSKDIKKSSQSHYFIKFTNSKSLDENLESLKHICFQFNNTVGPKSISKQELIFEFNKYII